MKSHGIVFLIFMLCIFSGCISPNVPSLLASKPGFCIDEDEVKLIRQADIFSQELEEKELLFNKGEEQVYLNAVGARLIPADVGEIVDFRFCILRDSVVNAFALPNGRIYITVGLLARLENEAQLAQVLGHEIAHIVLRHQLKEVRNRARHAPVVQMADAVLLGTSVAYIPYVLAVASYSREHEEEADRMSLDLMSSAGYRLEEIYGIFKTIEEVKTPDTVKGSIYSSHPSNRKREIYFRKMIQNGTLKTNPKGKIGKADYERMRKGIYLEAVRLKLFVKHYELALELLDPELEKTPRSAMLHYYRGEAYRGMGDDPQSAAKEQALLYGKKFDHDLVTKILAQQDEFYRTAKEEYLRTLEFDVNFAQAYRGLGLVAFQQQDYPFAREALKQYLLHAKEVPDQRYITSLLKEISE